MFARLLKWIREVLLGIMGGTDSHPAQDIAVSSKMEKAIGLWAKAYKNEAPWITGSVKSLGLPAAVASELARQVTIEFKSDITGEGGRAEYLNKQYQPLLGSLRAYTEYGCAKGGLIFKPYPDRYKGIAVDVVQADGFAPTSFDSRGGITGAVFTERLTKGKQIYTRYEYHSMTDSDYTIRNIAYQSSDAAFNGRRISLASVPEWADLLPEAVLEGISKPLFGYFRVPFANTIDPDSPLGVSVYSRAMDLFEQADKQWERIQWEYKGGELAIDVSEDLFEHRMDGSVILPEGQERLFRAHDIDMGQSNGKFLEVFSPEIRDMALFNGLNGILKRIEFNCGLAYGTLSDPQEIEKTAQEIKSGKQRSYSTVSDIQKALQKALEDTVYAMDVWCTINKLAPGGKYAMTFDWDDSIVVDSDTARMQDKEDVRDGLMPKYEYRMKWYGENEDTAKKMTGAAQSDDEIYRAVGMAPVPLPNSKALLGILLAGLTSTAGLFENLTRTTANTATRQFERALDRAYMKIVTGGFDYTTTIRQAIKELAAQGVGVIRYPTGHRDTLEVAVRRALLTGVNRTAGRLQDARAKEMDCDLVETTAHAGARPSHQLWQGKVFSRSGKHPKYPDFIHSTGYGTGPGLCGWNCKHNFFPFFEGLSVPADTKAELRAMADRTVTYNGEQLSIYDATQKQRAIERGIRRWKREKAALSAAGLDSTQAAAKVQEWQAAMRDFINQTGLRRENSREQVTIVKQP